MKSDEESPKKSPRKNKRQATWKDRALEGAVAIGLFGVGATAYHETRGNIDLNLRSDRHVRRNGEDWLVLADNTSLTADRLMDEGIIDERKIRKAFVVDDPTKRIVRHNEVYPKSPENPILKKIAPTVSEAISDHIRIGRFGDEAHKMAAYNYRCREELVKEVLWYNLLKKAWEIYSQGEGKAFAQKTKHSPRNAILEHLETMTNVDREALRKVGLFVPRWRHSVDLFLEGEDKGLPWLIEQLRELPEDATWSEIHKATKIDCYGQIVTELLKDFTFPYPRTPFRDALIGELKEYVETGECKEMQLRAVRSYGILEAIEKMRSKDSLER